MHVTLRQQLIEETLRVIELVAPLLVVVAKRDRDLVSQIRRALSSVGLNLAEGFGNARGNSRLRFESARGSLYEAQAGLRIAIAWGFLSASEAQVALAELDKLAGRVYGLMRR